MCMLKVLQHNCCKNSNIKCRQGRNNCLRGWEGAKDEPWQACNGIAGAEIASPGPGKRGKLLGRMTQQAPSHLCHHPQAPVTHKLSKFRGSHRVSKMVIKKDRDVIVYARCIHLHCTACILKGCYLFFLCLIILSWMSENEERDVRLQQRRILDLQSTEYLQGLS